MNPALTLIAAAVVLALGAAGCRASGTATNPATDDPSVAKAGGGDGTLALGRAAIARCVDYGTPTRTRRRRSASASTRSARAGSRTSRASTEARPAPRDPVLRRRDVREPRRFRALAQPAPGLAGGRRRPRVPPDDAGRAHRQLPALPPARPLGPEARPQLRRLLGRATPQRRPARPRPLPGRRRRRTRPIRGPAPEGTVTLRRSSLSRRSVRGPNRAVSRRASRRRSRRAPRSSVTAGRRRRRSRR